MYILLFLMQIYTIPSKTSRKRCTVKLKVFFFTTSKTNLAFWVKNESSALHFLYMGVSKYSGTPKSSILIGFSMKFTIHFGGFTPIFGSTPIFIFSKINRNTTCFRGEVFGIGRWRTGAPKGEWWFNLKRKMRKNHYPLFFGGWKWWVFLVTVFFLFQNGDWNKHFLF